MHLQVFTLLLLVTCAQGSVSGGRLETETNKWGTEISFCTYEGIRFLPGSTWKTTDCVDCSCSEDGLFCQGFGYAAGYIDAPPSCQVVNDGCVAKLVDEDDELLECTTE